MTTPKRTFVLDTNVLIADPQAFGYPATPGRPGAEGRFEEHDVVIPIRVVEELEGLRHRPFEVGFAAREALRNLEAIRVAHGSVTEPVTVNPLGGTVRIELNNTGRDGLHEALQSDTSDHRIIAVAKNLADAGTDVVLVSKDAPVRIKASVAGISAQEYRNEMIGDSGWTGVIDVEVPQDFIDRLYAVGGEGIDLADAPDVLRGPDVVVNACLTLGAARSGALARVHADKRIRVLNDHQSLGKIRGRNAQQRFAIDLLLDPTVGIVSLSGPPGTGKTMLSVLAGLDAPKGPAVRVFRPIDPVGDQQMGFLPGTASEKMEPYAAAIKDSLEAAYAPHEIESLFERRRLTVEPASYVRGRTLRGVTIIDEAQSYERRPLEALISRAGDDSKVVLCWDPAQSDNSRATPEAGVAGLRDRFKGHPIFGHVALTRTERSPIAKAFNEVVYGTS